MLFLGILNVNEQMPQHQVIDIYSNSKGVIIQELEMDTSVEYMSRGTKIFTFHL